MPPHHLKAGTFYRSAEGEYLLAVGCLRHKPHTLFVMLVSDDTEYEYNTGVYSTASRSLCLSKGGAKYQLRPARGERRQDPVRFQCQRKAQVSVPACYQMLDHDFVLKLPGHAELTPIPYHPQGPYTHAYQLYVRFLNEFTQSQSFQAPVTGCQLQAAMSWVIACPPPVPMRIRASCTQECGGVAPNSAIYCRDPSGGATTAWRDGSLGADDADSRRHARHARRPPAAARSDTNNHFAALLCDDDHSAGAEAEAGV